VHNVVKYDKLHQDYNCMQLPFAIICSTNKEQGLNYVTLIFSYVLAALVAVFRLHEKKFAAALISEVFASSVFNLVHNVYM
jgi:hypothetical protein